MPEFTPEQQAKTQPTFLWKNDCAFESNDLEDQITWFEDATKNFGLFTLVNKYGKPVGPQKVKNKMGNEVDVSSIDDENQADICELIRGLL